MVVMGFVGGSGVNACMYLHKAWQECSGSCAPIWWLLGEIEYC
jgi:hypothetical protein